jgi:ABC-type dipeptide/oligopeptide/nickel transport system ATPase component
LNEPLLQADGLVRHYQIRRGSRLFSQAATLRAVDGVSFALQPGRTLGLVGESGCGKTTTARLVLGLLPLTAGEIRLQGETLPQAGSGRWRELRRVMQMVYQDPLAALDRRIAVGRQVMEPLVIHAIGTPAERVGHAAESTHPRDGPLSPVHPANHESRCLVARPRPQRGRRIRFAEGLQQRDPTSPIHVGNVRAGRAGWLLVALRTGERSATTVPQKSCTSVRCQSRSATFQPGHDGTGIVSPATAQASTNAAES